MEFEIVKVLLRVPALATLSFLIRRENKVFFEIFQDYLCDEKLHTISMGPGENADRIRRNGHTVANLT